MASLIDEVVVTDRQHAKNVLQGVMGSLNDGHARYPVPELAAVYDFLDKEIYEPVIGDFEDFPRWGIRINVFGIDSRSMAHTYSISRWVDEAATRERADEIAQRVITLYEQDIRDDIQRMIDREGSEEPGGESNS